MIEHVTIIGTGLIGSSIGLALRGAGFQGSITGIDQSSSELAQAQRMGAVTHIADFPESWVDQSTLIVLAVPVLAILNWTARLAPILQPHQLLTDAGSTKQSIANLAAALYNAPNQPRFLPGHPMAGKESGGAALADASLFRGATWLFTPLAEPSPIEQEWRTMVRSFGSHIVDLDPARHDKVCAWVSHLPQMLATALASLLEDELNAYPEAAQDFHAIGGRALREMTRLGASPYSMWRDIAHTNPDPIAATLFALEQRLAHLRENLRTPELREEFTRANAFRNRTP